MNKIEILEAIKEYIKANGLQEITGPILNNILKSITTIIPDGAMLTSSYGGIVTPTSSIDISPGKGRWFIANAGTYNNYGGYTYIASNLNILSYNGSTWDKIEIEMPQARAYIPSFEDSTFPLSGDIQLTYDNRIWQLKEGKTAHDTDFPSDESSIWESIGGGKFFEVPTISDLRLRKGTTNEVVTLLGYYRQGDKKPVNYIWSSDDLTDDGGGVINSNGGSWLAVFGGVVNLRDFGAKLNNIDYDDDAVARVSAYTYDKNITVELSANDILRISNDANFYRSKRLDFKGKVILPVGKFLIIGNRHTIVMPDDIYVNEVEGGGIIAQGIKNMSVKINRCPELWLWADGLSSSTFQSIAYCSFNLGYINKITISSQNGGWINENNFYLGRIQNLEINSLDASYIHNGNKFYGASLENSNVNINHASNNIFFNSRLEGNNTIVFGPNSFGNRIIKHWESYRGQNYRLETEFTQYTDNGYDNQITSFSKLSQDNISIYKVDYNSDNYSLDVIERTVSGKLKTKSALSTVFETGLIKVDSPFGIECALKGNSNVLLRAFITLYNSNKELITTKPIDEYAINSIGASWNSANNRYQYGVNRGNISIAIGKPVEFSYVKVIFLGNDASVEFDSLEIILKKQVNKLMSISVISENKKLTSSSIPTSTLYSNKIIESTNKTNGVIGWYYEGGWKSIYAMGRSAVVPNPIIDSINTQQESVAATIDALVSDFNSLVEKYNVSVRVIESLRLQLMLKLEADIASGQQAIS